METPYQVPSAIVTEGEHSGSMEPACPCTLEVFSD